MLCSERKGAASRVCSERNTTWENTFAANYAKSKQIYARKTICGDESATYSTDILYGVNDPTSLKMKRWLFELKQSLTN